MAINHTTNYQLCQWEATDKVLRTDFNEDNQKIDLLGNCVIFAGSYTGTGEAGADYPCTITFDFYPKVVILDTRTNHHANGTPKHFILFEGQTAFPGLQSLSSNLVTWGEKSVSWYFGSNDSDRPAQQFNTEGKVYHYIALGVWKQD